eukprot:2156472-Rhodomonas_salina.7
MSSRLASRHHPPELICPLYTNIRSLTRPFSPFSASSPYLTDDARGCSQLLTNTPANPRPIDHPLHRPKPSGPKDLMASRPDDALPHIGLPADFARRW